MQPTEGLGSFIAHRCALMIFLDVLVHAPSTWLDMMSVISGDTVYKGLAGDMAQWLTRWSQSVLNTALLE